MYARFLLRHLFLNGPRCPYVSWWQVGIMEFCTTFEARAGSIEFCGRILLRIVSPDPFALTQHVVWHFVVDLAPVIHSSLLHDGCALVSAWQYISNASGWSKSAGNRRRSGSHLRSWCTWVAVPSSPAPSRRHSAIESASSMAIVAPFPDVGRKLCALSPICTILPQGEVHFGCGLRITNGQRTMLLSGALRIMSAITGWQSMNSGCSDRT